MNDIVKQVLDFPSMVNQKIFNGKINTSMNEFNSQQGVRCYLKYFYQIASLVFLIMMEYTVITNAINYFSTTSDGMFLKIGSALSTVLFAYAAIPMAQVLRTHGDKFDSEHKNMVELVFKDFALINIRIMGEIIALSALFAALNNILAFIFDADLLTVKGTNIIEMINPIYTFPITALSAILESLSLTTLSEYIDYFYDMSLNSKLGSGNGYSFFELVLIAYTFFSVLMSLATMYVNIAIYKFFYTIAEKVVAFIPNFHIPIGMKNK